MNPPQTITLAFTGASGMPYGLRLLECLLAARCRVYLLYSSAAQVVAKHECDLVLPAQPREAARLFSERFGAREGQLTVFAREDWLAPVASGSNPADAMAVCPCSMGTLAAIAHGLADNLIERAADVMLKERRPLVLVPRETPLSSIHLDNMSKLAHAGGDFSHIIIHGIDTPYYIIHCFHHTCTVIAYFIQVFTGFIRVLLNFHFRHLTQYINGTQC